VRHYTNTNWGWGNGSSSRVFAYVGSPGFNLQYKKKKKDIICSINDLAGFPQGPKDS
jgi:hypothetical protein